MPPGIDYYRFQSYSDEIFTSNVHPGNILSLDTDWVGTFWSFRSQTVYTCGHQLKFAHIPRLLLSTVRSRTRFIIIPFDNGWPIHRTRKGMDGWISRKAQSNFGTSYCSCPVLTGSQQLTINVKLARLGNSEYQPAAVFGLTGVYLSWPRTDWTDWPEQSRSPPPPLCC